MSAGQIVNAPGVQGVRDNTLPSLYRPDQAHLDAQNFQQRLAQEAEEIDRKEGNRRYQYLFFSVDPCPMETPEAGGLDFPRYIINREEQQNGVFIEKQEQRRAWVTKGQLHRALKIAEQTVVRVYEYRWEETNVKGVTHKMRFNVLDEHGQPKFKEHKLIEFIHAVPINDVKMVDGKSPASIKELYSALTSENENLRKKLQMAEGNNTKAKKEAAERSAIAGQEEEETGVEDSKSKGDKPQPPKGDPVVRR